MGAQGGHFRHGLMLVALGAATLVLIHRAAADQVTQLPFFEGFESGALASYWAVDGTENYFTSVVSDYGPASGSYHLVMACTVNGTFSRNETTLSINLSNYENVILSFDAIDYTDESHGPPSYPYIEHADFDGVAVSADGIYWYEVASLRDFTSSYSSRFVDLDAAVAAAGIAYSSTFRIRFNQYDNFALTTDGIGIDNISITGDLKDDLSITPTDEQVIFGYEEGPFTTSNLVYDLQNVGSNTISWAIGCTNSWLHLSTNGGVVGPESSEAVHVSVDPGIHNWEPATNVASIVFTNETSGFVQYREIRLEIVKRELSGFIWDYVPTNLLAYIPFDVRITAVDQAGDVFSSFSDQANLSAFTGGGISAVGYYDMDEGAGSVVQLPSVEASGNTPVQLFTLDSNELASIEVLYAQNQGGSFGYEYESSMPQIEEAVSNGCVLIIHDRTVFGAAGSLPGGSGISLTSSFGANIEIGDAPEILTNGPGGAIDNQSLDNGNHSYHGYASVASLPAGSHVLLTTAQTNQAVTFSYPYGRGWVVYSTIPLDFYLSSTSATPQALRTAYAPNIVAYGAKLGGGGEQPVSITPESAGAFTSGVWTGAVTFLEVGTNIQLRVDDGADHIGESNPTTVDNLKLTLVLPDATSEGDPSVPARIFANYPLSSDVWIALDTLDTNSITMPPSVVLPAGQTSVMFDVRAVDDNLLDGTVVATVTASATNYLSGADSMYVYDNESASLAISLPQTTYEGAGSIAGSLVVSAPVDADVLVELISNNPSEIGAGSLIIPAGQSFASFSLPVLDDSEIDGVQAATVEAHVENWQSAHASVFVFDNETTGIDLQLPASLTEGDGVIINGGIVAIPATAVADITLLLTSSDPTELAVPGYVTIPAGTNQVAFNVSVVDDAETDGAVTLSVLAQASGYIPDSSRIIIADNDPHHLLVEGLSEDPGLYDPVSIVVSARTLDDDLADMFSETVSLNAHGDRGAVSITPSALSNMVDGVVSGTVSFGHIGNDVLLVASGDGLTGNSTVFNVTGSQIAISPSSLTNTLVVAGESFPRTMVFSNAGNADLEFEVQAVTTFSNLVINGGFEAGNSGFTSDYAYTPGANSQANGIYTVADDSKTWNESFTTTMKDHTSGGGQMLMANGDSTGNAVVWQQEVPVVAGFTYNVSAWTASLFGEFHPSLNFQVNGASVGSINTEHLTWTEFTTQWKAISSRTVTFSIVDTQFIPPFLPGNHFAIDDIVFQPVRWDEVESDPALIAYYPFTGNANDASTNGYDGTVYGAVRTTDRFGSADSAYYIDGIYGRIDLPSDVLNFERTNSFSDAFWIKTSDTNTQNTIIAKMASSLNSRGFNVVLANGLLRVQLISDDPTGNKLRVDGATVVSDDQWHHIVITYDGSSMASGLKLYVDGSLENMTVVQDSLTETIRNNVTPTIGSRNNGYYYRGAIDGVRIYNRALSEAEVSALYTVNGGGSNPFDVSWLSADPDSGIIAPGSNITVAAVFEDAGLMPGDYTNAALIITCNDLISPSNDLPTSMYVIPPAPMMDAEPDSTYGVSNTLSWSMVDGPVTYLVEVATNTVSAALQQSGWLDAINHTFNALATNQIYYYRARASVESDIGRLEGPWSGWVWSTQLPALVDGDGDGMPDWWEELHFGGAGIAGALTDFDGDGQSDHDEFIAGMNPINSSSYFMINDASVPTNGQFVVYWDAVTGRVYSVQWKGSMTNAFTPMATNIFYPQGSYTDEVHQAEESGFYRIDVELR